VGRLFTGEETWIGGFYELALEFGAESADMLPPALEALWATPGLQGCYLRRDLEPAEQARVAPSLAAQEANGHLYGVATLPSGQQVACGTVLIKESDGTAWLDFYLPLGALATAWEVGGYPFDNDPASQRWREPLERWLAGIGQAVFSRAPFRLGLIGFEVSGSVTSQELRSAGVPPERFISYLCPTAGQLAVYPTNQWHYADLPAL
jgi:hypothetical protein